jgi:hypothetical protein
MSTEPQIHIRNIDGLLICGATMESCPNDFSIPGFYCTTITYAGVYDALAMRYLLETQIQRATCPACRAEWLKRTGPTGWISGSSSPI